MMSTRKSGFLPFPSVHMTQIPLPFVDVDMPLHEILIILLTQLLQRPSGPKAH